MKRWFVWCIGRIFWLFGKTCGDLEDSYYIGMGQLTRRPCVLPAGHISPCCTEWNWSSSLNAYVRIWWATDDTGTYSRAEIQNR